VFHRKTGAMLAEFMSSLVVRSLFNAVIAGFGLSSVARRIGNHILLS
jgi:hypothetical protein